MTLVNKLIKGSDEPDLKYQVITALSTQKHSKLANKMVKHYQLDMKYFPKLYEIAERNANFYMISRALNPQEKDDHMPLNIIEDNFVGNPLALIKLCQELHKRNRINEAMGIFFRHGLHQFPQGTFLSRAFAGQRYD